MKSKTILTILLVTITLTACGTPSAAAPFTPADTIAAWTAAVRADDWDTATALMGGDTTTWLAFADSARRAGRWETTTIVGGPTPVAGGQQYGLHWYRDSADFSHRCSFIVLDDQGKIHADTQFVNCGQFESLK